MNYKDWVPEFSLRNHTLAFLAAEAAIDIDNYTQGRSKETESVKYLSQLLNEVTQGENPRAKLPDNRFVLGYSISGRERFEEYWKGRHSDEVVLQTNLVAKELKDFETLPKHKQEELGDFCVGLSKEVAYNHSQYYSRNSRLVA